MNGARDDAHAGGHSAVHSAPGGLAVSAAGYTLQVSPKTFEAGQEEAFGLRILDRFAPLLQLPHTKPTSTPRLQTRWWSVTSTRCAI
jgi:hypothetical protein